MTKPAASASVDTTPPNTLCLVCDHEKREHARDGKGCMHGATYGMEGAFGLCDCRQFSPADSLSASPGSAMTAMTEKHVAVLSYWVRRSKRGGVSGFGEDEIPLREILSNIQSQLPSGNRVLVERSEVEDLLNASDRYGGPFHTAACNDWTDDACYCGAFRLQKALRSLRKATP